MHRKIYTNTAKGYGFTQSDIDKFENEHTKYCELNKNGIDRNDGMMKFLSKQTDKRAKLYGQLLYGIPTINQILDKKHNKNISKKGYAKILWVFDIEYTGGGTITNSSINEEKINTIEENIDRDINKDQTDINKRIDNKV